MELEFGLYLRDMILILLFSQSFNISAFHKKKTECFVGKQYHRFIGYADSLLRIYPEEDDIWFGLIEANHFLKNESEILALARGYIERRKNRKSFRKIADLFGGSRRRRGLSRELIPELVEHYRELTDDQHFYSWEMFRYYVSNRRYRDAVDELVKAIDQEPERLQAGFDGLKRLLHKTDSTTLIRRITDSRFFRGRDLILAMSAFEAKRHEDAAHLFLKHSYTEGLVKVSKDLASAGCLDEALKVIRKIKGVDDQTIGQLFFLARDYLSALNHSDDPYLRAECLIYLGRYQEAIKELSDRKDQNSLRLRSLALVGQGAFQEAIKIIKNSRSATLQFLLSKLYLSQANIKIGYEILIKLGDNTKDTLANDALFWRMIIEKVDFDTTLMVHYARGALFYEIGDYEKAKGELTVFTDDSPVFDYVTILLAEIYLAQRELEWARVATDKARRLRPESPIMARLLLIEIKILKRLGNRGAAQSLKDTLLLRFPDSPEAESVRE